MLWIIKCQNCAYDAVHSTSFKRTLHGSFSQALCTWRSICTHRQWPVKLLLHHDMVRFIAHLLLTILQIRLCRVAICRRLPVNVPDTRSNRVNQWLFLGIYCTAMASNTCPNPLSSEQTPSVHIELTSRRRTYMVLNDQAIVSRWRDFTLHILELKYSSWAQFLT